MDVEHLAYFGGRRALEGPHQRFTWPLIDDDVIVCIRDQLRDTISIYDRSSIFLKFEKDFASFHGIKHCVLFNSGTSALHAAYDALSLKPGDEVVCAGYNFHASISPAMQYGIRPSFCDVDDFGNMDFESCERTISSNTKCVVVTHMWGNPCAGIEKISRLCRDKDIFLVEDCSHAHGAKIDGRLVGTFGDLSAWSLQGQKVISGGEGGVLATNCDDFYYNSLLFGHYNKRSSQEIPQQHELWKYSTTGKGLKLRAHPLAIAIAYNQFLRLQEIMTGKAKNASKFDRSLNKFGFVRALNSSNTVPSLYAYTFLFDENLAGVSRSQFVELLQAEGLVEFDIPGSTGDITNYKLFSDPEKCFPHLDWSKYHKPNKTLHNVSKVSNALVKLPVWALNSDADIVSSYCTGFEKVASSVATIPELGRQMRILEN